MSAHPATTTITTDAVVLQRHRTDVHQFPSSLLCPQTVPVPELAPGEIRVRNLFQQVVAVNADLLFEHPGLPLPGFDVGQPIYGSAVGEVIETRADMPVGTVVYHSQGWRSISTLPAAQVFPVPIDSIPGPEYMLTQGVTSYHGIVDIAQVGPGDVVLVSGAAGGVGSVAGQIAKGRGATRVIGVAGGGEKCRYLVDELGFDEAIDHRNEDLNTRLGELAPDGIDVFFDTVGGTQFEIAQRHAAFGARFALCGALAGQIGGGEGGHPRLDIMNAIVREIQIRPFTTMHTPDQIRAWFAYYIPALADGSMTLPLTLIDGDLTRAISALDELLAGVHRGNVIVKLTHAR